MSEASFIVDVIDGSDKKVLRSQPNEKKVATVRLLNNKVSATLTHEATI